MQNGILDSNGTSRSNSIIRPASSGSDEKKRYSAANGLPPLNALNSLPQNNDPLSANGGERKYGNFQFPPTQGQGYQETQSRGYYNPTAPSSGAVPGQNDSNPSFLYQQRSQLPQYSNGAPQQQQQQNGAVKQEDWTTYFQNNNQDPLMSNFQ